MAEPSTINNGAFLSARGVFKNVRQTFSLNSAFEWVTLEIFEFYRMLIKNLQTTTISTNVNNTISTRIYCSNKIGT